MDERRLLAHRVLSEGWSLSCAARESGVSRPTAYKWLERAQVSGLPELKELSRRPLLSPGATPASLEAELLALKAKYPAFGPRKLCVLMEGRLKERTAARLLARHGLSCPQSPRAPVHRFEREQPNELWQMDFKGMRMRRPPYEVLSVLDDASRFCIALPALTSQRLDVVWDALWGAFEVYGLPDAILCDNGPTFRNNGTWRPSTLDLRLMRLGVRCLHGRPYHPQTQGKVERFHGAMARELGPALWQPTIEEGLQTLQGFRDTYNWVRPHEAIEMKVPGAVYKRSTRERPSKLPKPNHPAEAKLYTVNRGATIFFQGQKYRLGRALIGETVELTPHPDGWHVTYYQNELGLLQEYKD